MLYSRDATGSHAFPSTPLPPTLPRPYAELGEGEGTARISEPLIAALIPRWSVPYRSLASGHVLLARPRNPNGRISKGAFCWKSQRFRVLFIYSSADRRNFSNSVLPRG